MVVSLIISNKEDGPKVCPRVTQGILPWGRIPAIRPWVPCQVEEEVEVVLRRAIPARRDITDNPDSMDNSNIPLRRRLDRRGGRGQGAAGGRMLAPLKGRVRLRVDPAVDRPELPKGGKLQPSLNKGSPWVPCPVEREEEGVLRRDILGIRPCTATRVSIMRNNSSSRHWPRLKHRVGLPRPRAAAVVLVIPVLVIRPLPKLKPMPLVERQELRAVAALRGSEKRMPPIIRARRANDRRTRVIRRVCRRDSTNIQGGRQ
mmetsp:Transcript_44367/g.79605  ORF Transcript_44367/g.79605 Transcript_44367/m.79605 type:complete len:259 (+) Transcript_44367:2055-2831(+)